jgi:hypothetical protein
MDYLGRDKAMAQAQLLLLSEERAALRTARDAATKQVGARVVVGGVLGGSSQTSSPGQLVVS